MNYQRRRLRIALQHIQILYIILFFTLLLPSIASAGTNHYQGHGISFDYPAKYTLSEKRKKSSQSIRLKNGSNSIEIGVMDNVLMEGFDDIVIQTVTKQFQEKGYVLSDAKKEAKQIPLLVRGERRSINVDTVKFYHAVEVVEDEIRIKVLQTMFFFSYGDHGYTVNYSRIKGKYSDLVTLLSTFSFDEKEQVGNTEKAAAY